MNREVLSITVTKRGRRFTMGDTIVVAGAGGFIGGHLVKSLLADGFQNVRAIDYRELEEWHQI
jgi:nucleoside-diphosphate-sugar epimerase